MRALPLADPGVPDHRTPAAYLRWVARGQWHTILVAMVFGIGWMLAQALMPAAIGKAVDAGLVHRDAGALLDWAAVLLGLGVVQAGAGLMRHRMSVTNFLTGAYRTVQVVARHSALLGATLPRRIATGEVVSVGATDINQVGGLLDISGRLAGSVASFIAVAVILLATSVPLGLLVLVGVPLLVLAIGPLLRPLHRRQAAQRALGGEMASYAADIVTGLRVLRGVGGEEVFSARYRERSQRVKAAGYRVATVDSLLDSTQILLPGIFVVLVTWLGARFALDGVITPGQLVAFYGYAAFLVQPLSTGTEAADKLTRGLVAARRIVHVLDIRPEVTDPPDPLPVPPGPADVELHDGLTGLSVAGGRLTVVVLAGSDGATPGGTEDSAAPRAGVDRAVDAEDGGAGVGASRAGAVGDSGAGGAAALADRLGRYTDSAAGVLLRGVPVDRLALSAVRATVLVSDTESRLFAGRLRDQLDPSGTLPEERVREAVAAASGTDILDALPDGLDGEVEERGRSFSGGQRQRLVLARALLADPEVLILVEPTSAVDAHTEARIAERLGRYRAGRTTVVLTESPLLADRADTVCLVRDGAVAATGSHAELVATEPAYRAAVLRGEDEPAEATR